MHSNVLNSACWRITRCEGLTFAARVLATVMDYIVFDGGGQDVPGLLYRSHVQAQLMSIHFRWARQ